MAHCRSKPANFHCRYKRLMALMQVGLAYIYILRLIYSPMETAMEEWSTPTSQIPPYFFPSLARTTLGGELHDGLSTTGNAASNKKTIIMADSSNKTSDDINTTSSQPECQPSLHSQPRCTNPHRRAIHLPQQRKRRQLPLRTNHLPKNAKIYKPFRSYRLIYRYTRLTQGRGAA